MTEAIIPLDTALEIVIAFMAARPETEPLRKLVVVVQAELKRLKEIERLAVAMAVANLKEPPLIYGEAAMQILALAKPAAGTTEEVNMK